ncbi:MAG: hypothetical protein HFJ09_07190 [Lachnospiraceae bacterium]|nr:hypothetical protein [Lachnospiraceae bacterium]
MEDFVQALYNERRNAIPSWQGYHYQAMVAVYKYLEFIWDRFQNKKVVPEQVIAKIEWLEDFVIEDNGRTEEIYQVKKTLTNANRKEILQNFILQYKLSGQNDTKWKIVFDEPQQSTPLAEFSESEFEQIYKEYIEEKFISELRELESNVEDTDYWKSNLSLQNGSSKLKTIRSYIRKWIETKNYQYNTVDETQCICKECIQVVCDKLGRQKNDYKEFYQNLEFLSCPINSLAGECQNLIKTLSAPHQGAEPYIKRNKSLLETEILDKLYCKIYSIMMSLKSKAEGDKFFLSLKDLKNAFLDAENTNYKWQKLLWDRREEFLEIIKEDVCSDCSSDHGEYCEDRDCVFGTIKDWDMKEIIDNMSLEFPVFNVEDPYKSISNKIANVRLEFLQDVFNKYKRELNLLDRKILEFKDKNIFLSSIISGGKSGKKRMKTNIINNFLEHVEIYKDYDKILTKEFQSEIQQDEIHSIMKKKEIQEEQKHPSFMDISTINFVTKVE